MSFEKSAICQDKNNVSKSGLFFPAFKDNEVLFLFFRKRSRGQTLDQSPGAGLQPRTTTLRAKTSDHGAPVIINAPHDTPAKIAFTVFYFID